MEVNGKHYTAKHILVAVGGRAFVPDIVGKEYAITSDEALDLPSRPEKIGIIGGGYISLEFAGIFNSLGSEVHVFIRQNKVLRGFDEEVNIFHTYSPHFHLYGKFLVNCFCRLGILLRIR